MNKKGWLIIGFILFTCTAFSQTEELFMLGQNDTIIATRKNVSHLKSTGFVLPYTDFLTLPFYDDFARPGVFPYQKNWADQNVYINNTFCILPPSLGVATFDALGSDGLLHYNASSSVFAADTLTSQPFNFQNHIVGAISDNLYKRNTSGSFDKISDSMYYKVNTSFKSLISAVYFYTSVDTLYRVDSTYFVNVNGQNIPHYIYGAINDSIFTKTALGYEYITGSKMHQKTIKPYSTSDSLYLSFSVQPGGIGDMPESLDSLIMEWYVPHDTTTKNIIINEVASSWIEFYNPTDTIVNIGGYYLFNDSLNRITTKIDTSKQIPLKRSYFQIPNDGSIETRIPPLGLLVVNASDLNSTALPNFKSKIIMLIKDTISYSKSDSVYISDTTSRETASFGRDMEGSPFDGSTALTTKSKNALNGAWNELWSISSDGLTASSFTKYIVPISKSYLRKGFRFRFVNYASLSTDLSHARNEDQWNLDEVTILSNHTSSFEEPDLKLRNVDASIYDDYSSVPYNHVFNINEESIQSYLTYDIKSTDSLLRKVDWFMTVQDEGTKKNSLIKKPFGNEDIPSLFAKLDTLNFNGSISLYDMFLQNADSTVNKYSDFDIKMFYTDNESPLHEDYRWNDTVRIRQSFYNYYSYDDGSSEAGWGIRGVEYAQVAYKFTTYKRDTLNSILIYFNQTLNTTDPTFNLCVWADNKGKPGKLLAQQSGEYINYAKGVNLFSLYPIKTESIIDTTNKLIFDRNQTFYIGWIQPQDILLNVGVDLNKTVKKKLFFKTGLDWQESLITNPIMLRPVFDKNPNIVKVTEITKHSNDLLIYPNPTTGICTIAIADKDISGFEIVVKTVLGQEIRRQKADRMLDLSDLPNSLYYVSLISTTGEIKTGKLIINR